MKYETITKEQIESIVKYCEIKPIEEDKKEDNNSEETKTETKKTRKIKSSENEE